MDLYNEKRIRLLEKKLLECESELYRKDIVIEEFDNNVQDLKNEISKLKKLLYKERKENRDQSKYISKCEDVINELEEKIERLKYRIKELTSRNKMANLNAQINHLNSLIATHVNEKNRLQEENNNLKTIFNDFEKLVKKLNDENKKLNSTLNEYDDKIKEIEDERYSMESKLHNRYLKKERLKKQVIELEDDNEKLNERGDMWLEKYERMRYSHAIKTIKNYRLQRRLTTCQYDKAMVEYGRDDLENRYRKKKRKGHKWKDRTKYERGENRRLNDRILYLQNNINPQPIVNMAQAPPPGLQDVTNTISPLLAEIPKYKGQEPPDEYIDNIEQIFLYGATLGVQAFNDDIKTRILRSKMSGKYLPVPVAYPVGTNIDTPATFRVWLRHRYHELTQGTQGASIAKLAMEKFLPNDTPKSYEDRVRLLLLNTANNNEDALALMLNHLPDELFTRIEQLNPRDIDAFFTAVKNAYMKRKPTTFTYSNNNAINILSNLIPNNNNLKGNEPTDEVVDFIYNLALQYGYPDNRPKDLKAMMAYIDLEGGIHGYNMIRQPRSGYNVKGKNVKNKKSVRHCSNCGSVKHTKKTCKSKRKSRRMNYARKPESESESADEESETSESETSESSSNNSESEDNESRHFNAGKKKHR